MADMRILSREWGVEVDFLASDEIPDIRKQFTSLTFRPHFAYIKFSAGKDQRPRFEKAIVSGRRVLKNGNLGVMVDASYYKSDIPDWLESVIDQAKGLIRG